ncbi:hypothetical protein ACGC1H_001397 [Rhizoctonia solani]|uniref:ADP-ribosylation factor-like protein 1 n=1 Tax=Rhizoctonia solani TaxID=456999 RepID=A0A8H2XSN1_9AGAM|nr:unnamed protein product [Rhizoctonia solani]
MRHAIGNGKITALVSAEASAPQAEQIASAPRRPPYTYPLSFQLLDIAHLPLVMGVTLSSIFGSLSSLASWGKEKDVRILMVGLDSAGKTTILYRLQIGEVVSTIPTIGFNVESVTYKNIKFQVWDLGGQSSIRPYWRCYYANTHAIIYVIDASDHDRLQTSRAELLTMLAEEELKGVPVLVFSNKQDVPGALPPGEVSDRLGLAGAEKGREWSVRGSCATKGEGLEEGLDWLVATIQKK